MEDKKKKDMVDSLKIGDTLLIRNKKNLPNPIDENIKTLETELVIEDIKPNYITVKYKTTKAFSNENDGIAENRINFFRNNVKEFFKKFILFSAIPSFS